ncbi:MAG: tail fiber domain-containing protein [Bryobacteraceae bacterium]
MNRIPTCLAVCGLLAMATVLAQVPQVSVPRLVSFSGVLRDQTGQPRTGPLALTFAIYPDQESQTPFWQETQSVTLDEQGRYSVQLGSTQPDGIPVDLFTSGKALWLGVQPAGEAEQPRVLLVSVPYALKAADADTLGGKPASAYLLAGSEPAAPGVVAPASGSGSLAQVSPGQLVPQAVCGSLTADGNAAPNQVAIYSGACALTEDTKFVDVSGRIGVGTSAPQAPLDVRGAFTATSGTLYAQDTLASFNPSANSTATGVGNYVQAGVMSGNANNVSLIASLEFLSFHEGMGTVSFEEGMQGKVYNEGTGTVTTAEGIYAQIRNESAGTINSGYGLYVDAPLNSGGGTFTNYYGLYLANPTAATKNYSLYSAGGTNYFAGSVGMGTATPSAALEVNGTAKFDGLATFAGGQTFPGTLTGATAGGGLTVSGSTVGLLASCASGQVLSWSGAAWQCASGGGGAITGVTAGTDLTGGGTSGAVTLNVDTTKVPQLAANNTFTGQEIINAPSGIGALEAGGGSTTGTPGGFGVFALGGSAGGTGDTYGGNGVVAFGGTGVFSGDGIDAYGGSGGVAGYGISAQGGTGSDGVQQAAGNFDGRVLIQSDDTNPQVTLWQQLSLDYARIRFTVNGATPYWDLAIGGGTQPVMNFYESGVGNVMSLAPGTTKFLNMSNGAYLSSGGVWTNNSDRNLKTAFQDVSGAEVLERLNAIPISTWSYKSEGEAVRHMGPTAQDFAGAFQLGNDDKHITTIDESGVALAAIQELYRQNRQKDSEIQQLKSALADLQARVAALATAAGER